MRGGRRRDVMEREKVKLKMVENLCRKGNRVWKVEKVDDLQRLWAVIATVHVQIF